MDSFIDLKKLTLAELTGVVNIYPWFASARKELYSRVGGMGGNFWTDVAMYLPDQKTVNSLIRSSAGQDCSDKDIATLLERSSKTKKEEEEALRPKVRVVGGDFFSPDDYEQLQSNPASVFDSFKPSWETSAGTSADEGIFTETLAGIYADQGYLDEARDIYSKLILAYPEKSAYFAALIEKLN